MELSWNKMMRWGFVGFSDKRLTLCRSWHLRRCGIFWRRWIPRTVFFNKKMFSWIFSWIIIFISFHHVAKCRSAQSWAMFDRLFEIGGADSKCSWSLTQTSIHAHMSANLTWVIWVPIRLSLLLLLNIIQSVISTSVYLFISFFHIIWLVVWNHGFFRIFLSSWEKNLVPPDEANRRSGAAASKRSGTGTIFFSSFEWGNFACNEKHIMIALILLLLLG